ncbi:hypothetical protein PMAYCL1PPCAC_04610, partial [Pristionchus mayeri]
MNSPSLLCLALLAAFGAEAADFDWKLCDKETACFFGGGGCGASLTATKTQPAAPCNVKLSMRAYDSSMKTLLVRARLQGSTVDYAKG